MTFETASWTAMIGFIGVFSAYPFYRFPQKAALRKVCAVFLVLTALCCIAMILQGFHLWGRWDIDLSSADPSTIGRTAAKSRGRGGIVLAAIQFFPQFLVFGYGYWLWNMRTSVVDSIRILVPSGESRQNNLAPHPTTQPRHGEKQKTKDSKSKIYFRNDVEL